MDETFKIKLFCLSTPYYSSIVIPPKKYRQNCDSTQFMLPPALLIPTAAGPSPNETDSASRPGIRSLREPAGTLPETQLRGV
jgi:hypothetical protein